MSLYYRISHINHIVILFIPEWGINTHLHVVYAMFVEPSAALVQIRELIYYIGPNHFPYQLKLAKQYVNIEYICLVRFD